jgi:hypothetical protein
MVVRVRYVLLEAARRAEADDFLEFSQKFQTSSPTPLPQGTNIRVRYACWGSRCGFTEWHEGVELLYISRNRWPGLDASSLSICALLRHPRYPTMRLRGATWAIPCLEHVFMRDICFSMGIDGTDGLL